MRNIYVVAHPEATHHVDGLVGGWHDSQLTPNGLGVVDRIAKELRARISEDTDVEIFSSDLQRAVQTANVVGELLDVKPILDSRLREKSYGEAEGKPQAWLNERFIPPPAIGDRMAHDEGIPGIENKALVAERIYAALDMILESSCEHQVIVTHGFAVTFVLAAWIKMSIDSCGHVNFSVSPGSITTLHEDDYFHNRQVASLNDTCHFDIIGSIHD